MSLQLPGFILHLLTPACAFHSLVSAVGRWLLAANASSTAVQIKRVASECLRRSVLLNKPNLRSEEERRV